MRMGQADQQVITDFYTYSVAFTTLGAQSSQTGQIQIEADSDFEIIKTTQACFQTLSPGGDGITVSEINSALVTVLLTDTGSGRQLMNIQLPIQNMFGTGELPFILPKPKLLFARSILAVTVSNLSDVSYAYLSLSFLGRKIFQV